LRACNCDTIEELILAIGIRLFFRGNSKNKFEVERDREIESGVEGEEENYVLGLKSKNIGCFRYVSLRFR
jgi:hypothetical protein